MCNALLKLKLADHVCVAAHVNFLFIRPLRDWQSWACSLASAKMSFQFVTLTS